MDELLKLKNLISWYEQATAGLAENEMLYNAFKELSPDMPISQILSEVNNPTGLPVMSQTAMSQRVKEIENQIIIYRARKKSIVEEIIKVLEEIKKNEEETKEK